MDETQPELAPPVEPTPAEPEATQPDPTPANPSINGPASIAFAAFVLIWGGWVVYNYFQERQVDTNLDLLIKSVPVIALADIDKYCDTNRPIALHLVTDSADDFGKEHARPHKTPPEAMAFRELRRLSAQGSRSTWLSVNMDRGELTLLDAGRKNHLVVDATQLDRSLLPTVYMAADFNKCDLQLPYEWIDEAVGQPTDVVQFKIGALPCNSRVLVVCTAAKVPEGYELRRFSVHHHRHNVIVKLEPGQKYADVPITGENLRSGPEL